MKKTIMAVAGLVVLLALPIAARGESAAMSRGGDDYQIRFTLKTESGEPKELRRFRFRRLDAVCDGDVVIQVRGRLRSIRVNNRNRFRKVLRMDGKTVRVRGKVSRDLNRVRGIIRARGDFDIAENCDSGRVRWKARL